MKIVRVDAEADDITYGTVEPDGIRLYHGSPFVQWERSETILPITQVKLLAPVIPTKVIAVGKNYADHAAEMDGAVPDSPVIFMKPPTSVIGPLAPIRLPKQSSEVHHEGELAIVMGKVTRHVGAEDALQHVLGYTAANDVTARDLQRADGQWIRAKGFDSFCPLGPVAELIEFVSSVMTLLPGDVILTGTPAGVGPITDGDRVEVDIEGIGVLMNPVVAS